MSTESKKVDLSAHARAASSQPTTPISASKRSSTGGSSPVTAGSSQCSVDSFEPMVPMPKLSRSIREFRRQGKEIAALDKDDAVALTKALKSGKYFSAGCKCFSIAPFKR